LASLGVLTVGVGSAGFAGAVESPAEDAALRDSHVPGSYIVVYRPSLESVGRKTDQLEREVGFSDELRYRHALEGFSAELSPQEARQLEAEPAVVSVEPDRLVQASASVPLASGEPTPPAGVRRIGAASSSTVREASSANVAVIDTGIHLTHPDLNAAAGKNCVNTSAAPQDDNGHGTHVAGTIAAKNDGAGVVGVAPGTKVYAAKVLNSSGSGSWSQIICGIDWATGTRTDADPNNDIAVANMSLGGLGSSSDNQPCGSTSALHQAICNSTEAGVTYAVAAGNDGWEFPHPTSPDVPAAYDEVVTVTAITDTDGQPGAAGSAPSCRGGEADDRYASFSNYSDNPADDAHTVAAPGVCVKSTWLSNGYNTISGTSMATPHVAGVIALCLGEGGASGPCAGLTPAQIVAKIHADAESQTTADPGYGFSGDPLHQPVSGRYYGYLSWAQPASASPPPPPAADTTPPSAGSTSPADAATAVATSTAVSVTFSEAMDKESAEAAFSLAPSANPAATVNGSFSWSGNVMTFRPSAALNQATGYTARVSAGATDLAQNQLAEEKTWSFTTRTELPGSTVIETGTLKAGTATSLGADDDLYYEVNSTTSGTRTTAWYGSFTGVPNGLSGLKVSYRGKNSRKCTQRLYIRRFSDNSWRELDSRSVNSTEVLVEKLPSGSAANYVSGTTGDGEVRVRVRCTTSSGSFVASADLMKIAYNVP
jgi:subtilisin family serine protease